MTLSMLVVLIRKIFSYSKVRISMQTHPIDAVITWVDGDDPAHQAKLTKYLPETYVPRGADPTRFASLDEITYCVLSILKFAPYFRKIYIVTDGQTPPVFEDVQRLFPDQIDKITIVDHKDIFKGHEAALPTFNSTSIITALHKIPNLSEHFVFFNDDFFLVRPTSPEDWFVDNKPVLRGRWFGKSLENFENMKSRVLNLFRVPKNNRKIGSKLRQLKSAKLAGFAGKCFVATHAPYPMRRSTLDTYFSKNPELFSKNISFRFRDAEQLVSEALSNHIEIANDMAHIAPHDQLVYISAFRASVKKAEQKIQTLETDENIKFLCIQSLDQAIEPVQKLLLDWIRERTI